MYQIYNKKELKNCNKKYLYKDIYYSNTEDKDIESQLDNLEEKIFNILNSNNNDTLFENIKISKTNIFGDKKIFFIPVDKIYDDYLILNTLKFNLEKAFQTKTSNRNTSIKSIKKILESFAGNLKDDFELHICKLDIKDFFESIKLKKIIDELYKRNILSNISFKILYQLLDAIVKKINLERLDYDKIGLPRGLNISSTLSEYYMQPIDNEIKKLDTVLYYTRYVDDIIIISSKKIEDNVIKIIKNKDLTINSEKTRSIEISKNSKEITFDYLGYCFDGYYTSNQKELKSNQKELKWKISISKHKINKIKNKIYYCFKCYKKNKKKLGDKDSIQILEKQIKYLSTSNKISNDRNLMRGIFFNYNFCTKDANNKTKSPWEENLITIDAYYHYQIKENIDTEDDKKILKKISFNAGNNPKKPIIIGNYEKTYNNYQKYIKALKNV